MQVSVCWEFKNLESGVHELWLVGCGVSGVESNSSRHFDIGRNRQPWDYDGNTMSWQLIGPLIYV